MVAGGRPASCGAPTAGPRLRTAVSFVGNLQDDNLQKYRELPAHPPHVYIYTYLYLVSHCTKVPVQTQQVHQVGDGAWLGNSWDQRGRGQRKPAKQHDSVLWKPYMISMGSKRRFQRFSSLGGPRCPLPACLPTRAGCLAPLASVLMAGVTWLLRRREAGAPRPPGRGRCCPAEEEGSRLSAPLPKRSDFQTMMEY